MKLEDFYKKRLEQEQKHPQFRELCLKCMQPGFGCYCEHVQQFDPQIKFVILIHPIEVRRRIATGRMSHLVLKNSQLIMGQDYTNNDQVNAILANPNYEPMVLYPGQQSLNLSNLNQEEKGKIFSPNKQPVLFVIDGTWNTARKTMWQSQNLKTLPKICFTPASLSQFRVRKQPDPNCFSTIEAIHYTIEMLGNFRGFDPKSRQHDSLIHVFNQMVERQLEFIRQTQADPSRSHYRFRRIKSA